MTTDFKSVPLIDVSGLYSDDIRDRMRVASDINYAARNIGFFYVKGHNVEEEAITDLKSVSEQFFAQPMESKLKYYIGNSKNHRGYVPEGEENLGSSARDHKEAVSIGRELPEDHPLVKGKVPLHGGNQWPTEIPGFKDKVLRYYEQIFALARTLIHGFALALEETEDSFDKYFTEALGMFRMIHYPFESSPTASNQNQQGIGEHTDYECFTILLADTPGLEAVNSKNEWVPIPPIPGTFIVNIGDTLEILTNRRFVATAHRVLKVNQERYSFPLFVGCNYNMRVAPLPQFIDGEVESKYGGVVSGDHIWSSIMQTYRYLQEKVKAGEIELPGGTTDRGTYGPPVFA